VFVAGPSKVVSSEGQKSGGSKDAGSISNMKEGAAGQLPSFWIPSLTPQASASVDEKPVCEPRSAIVYSAVVTVAIIQLMRLTLNIKSSQRLKPPRVVTA